MRRQDVLRPHDVCVLLQVALEPRYAYRELADAVGLSLGETHSAAKRLERAGLIDRGQESVNYGGALEFLSTGVPYVYPAQVGPEIRGVPTAFSAPPLSEVIQSHQSLVWASSGGSVRGASLVPLCPSAPEMAEKNSALYRLLTIIDGIRVGRARERRLAREHLEQELGGLKGR